MKRGHGKLGPADYYEVIESHLEVYSWNPTPEPVGDPTQVHLLIPVADGKIRIRFKAMHTIDQLIASLTRHREDVWGKPTAEDKAKAEERLGPSSPPADAPQITDFEDLFDALEKHHPIWLTEDDAALEQRVMRMCEDLGLVNPAARIQFAGQCAGLAMRAERLDSKLVLMRIIEVIVRLEAGTLAEVIALHLEDARQKAGTP